jgi:uncharacterized iron-regulated membrane protein
MLRKILFQIHLWSGIAVGLYVVAISLTGSLLVFRQEFYQYFRPGTRIEPRQGDRLNEDGLKAAAKKAYPTFDVSSVQVPRRNRTTPAEVWVKGGGKELHRLFDPYTGEDLGDAEPRATLLFEKVAQFHDNLLLDRQGRDWNGYGAVAMLIMSLTGIIIWWPGTRGLRRALLVKWNTSWKRFNWDLHNVLGFWSFVFIFMWALTGTYMIFPDPFLAVVDYLQPPSDAVPLRLGDSILEWFARVHIGRFSGMTVKIIWGVAGLVPPVLFVTGVIMWWNRKVRGWRRSEEGLFEQVRLKAYGTYVKAFFRT